MTQRKRGPSGGGRRGGGGNARSDRSMPRPKKALTKRRPPPRTAGGKRKHSGVQVTALPDSEFLDTGIDPVVVTDGGEQDGPLQDGPRQSGPRQRTRDRKDALDDGKIRLNRFLALSGVSSRRAADSLIAGGAVAINGKVTRELGIRVDPETDEVRCQGEVIKPTRPVYVLFNKPKGVVCTNADREQRRRVIDFLPPECGRLFTIGRLDADSEGLVMATNDGQFAQRMAHPKFGIAKTYSVVVRGRITQEVADKARGGVWLSDGKTAESKIVVERVARDRSYLRVSLREGRNREIRRVFAKLDHPVVALKRVRIGPLSLHGLGRARYRFLTREELQTLDHIATR